eukprot:TRINITY_DN1801_c0_g1_i12.p2 TRINITY_DN1801_c0_g1~~TRINITY_DN1801_c0_g1_i12.p2  ORF type:complete len:234 (+),score=40.60 TRINITY_DN1801_c0_g1_i12:1786-2487(+)
MGQLSGGNVVNCASFGAAAAPTLAGAFAGRCNQGSVSRSLAVGRVTGAITGGFCGSTTTLPVGITRFSETFFDLESTGTTQTRNSAVALSTQQAQSLSSASSGFDFDYTWLAIPNGYPRLRWGGGLLAQVALDQNGNSTLPFHLNISRLALPLATLVIGRLSCPELLENAPVFQSYSCIFICLFLDTAIATENLVYPNNGCHSLVVRLENYPLLHPPFDDYQLFRQRLRFFKI